VIRVEQEIRYIIEYPTTLDNVHESCFRSYHALNKVLCMIERGDSKETIVEFAEYMRGHIKEDYSVVSSNDLKTKDK